MKIDLGLGDRIMQGLVLMCNWTLMMSHVFWPFLTYLPTYLVLLYNLRFWGLSWSPLPTLKSDVINGCSLIRSADECQNLFWDTLKSWLIKFFPKSQRSREPENIEWSRLKHLTWNSNAEQNLLLRYVRAAHLFVDKHQFVYLYFSCVPLPRPST